MVTDRQFKELQAKFSELEAKYAQMSKDLAAIQMKLDITKAKKKEPIPEVQKDITRYNFKGKQLNKRQLVLACIKTYISDKDITDPTELLSVFPDFIQGSLGVIRKATEAEQYKDARNHYFFDDADILMFGEEYYVISKDWTAKNITRFIDIMETLGYEINLINRY